MTHSTRKTLSRGTLATLLLAVAPFTFGGEHPAPAAKDIQMIGSIVVTAPRPNPNIRSIADLGTMTVTAQRDALVADLGAMTVTSSREVVLADLGAMTVTATRELVMAGNVTPRRQTAF